LPSAVAGVADAAIWLVLQGRATVKWPASVQGKQQLGRAVR
jgi:hypothetical protein